MPSYCVTFYEFQILKCMVQIGYQANLTILTEKLQHVLFKQNIN